MDCTKSSVEKVENRGVLSGKCSICGERIMIKGIGRSIWLDDLASGTGEVHEVGEVYCPKCDGEPKLPSYGTPIYESEIIQMVTA